MNKETFYVGLDWGSSRRYQLVMNGKNEQRLLKKQKTQTGHGGQTKDSINQRASAIRRRLTNPSQFSISGGMILFCA